MFFSRVAAEEQRYSGYVFRPGAHIGLETEKYRYRTTVQMARAIDDMKLPHGAVLIDNFNPCVPAILLNARHPLEFVIPNDRDFERSLADPVTFHIKYLMVPESGGYGTLDALHRSYPKLYEDGAGIATLAKDLGGPGCPKFRLYKVNGSA
jgi:hypothetical protein